MFSLVFNPIPAIGFFGALAAVNQSLNLKDIHFKRE